MDQKREADMDVMGQEFSAIVRKGALAGRYDLADEVARFFNTRHLSEQEEHRVSELILTLIRQAELNLREALAERLSLDAHVPPEVVIYLANDQISVAKHVLASSPVLKDIDLIYIIAAQGEEHWRAIASRQKLGPVVTERLVDTQDTGTVLKLMENQNAVLNKASLKKIARIAIESEVLQRSLLRRPEIDADVVTMLYMCVSRELQKHIVEVFKLAHMPMEGALDALVQEFIFEAQGQQNVTLEMMALARRFHQRGDISTDLLIKALRRGQMAFFCALFSVKLGLPSDAFMRLVQKDNGMPFALACRAIGMMKSEFAAIYLLSRGVGIKGEAKEVNQQALAQTLKNYDEMKDGDIQRILRSWVAKPDMI